MAAEGVRLVAVVMVMLGSLGVGPGALAAVVPPVALPDTDLCRLGPAPPSGCPSWSLAIGGFDQLAAVVPDPQGGVFLLGGFEPSNSPSVVAAFAADGTHRWTRSFESAYSGVSFHPGLTYAEGGLYLAGTTSRSTGGVGALFIARLDPVDGGSRWQTVVEGDEILEVVGVVAGAGRVHVLGAEVLLGDFHPVVATLDSANGALTWLQAYPVEGQAFPHEARLEPSTGRLSFVGRQEGGPTRLWTVHAGSGAVQWTVVDDAPIAGAPRLALDAAGGLVLLADSVWQGGSYDVRVQAFEAASGERRWRHDFDGAAHRDDHLRDLAVAAGNVVVAASSSTSLPHLRPYEDLDVVTVLLDAADGQVRWTTVAEGLPASTDWPASVALSSEDGRVYVVGTRFDKFSQPFVHAYGLDDGALRWASPHPRTLWGTGHALAVEASPGGAMVVREGASLVLERYPS